MSAFNLVLDFVLIAAAVWMIVTVRGLGGVIGKGLNLITIGALILGMAHLISTGLRAFITFPDLTVESFIHRLIVLVGFIVLVVGFRQIETIKR
jgi:hypothetical protein